MPQHCILSIRLTTKTKTDQEKLNVALARLTQEDPALELCSDEGSGQIIISGMNEQHLETAIDRMKREHNVEIYADQPQVAFRETIRRQAEGEGLYIRETTGLGDYGHVKLRIEPNLTGKGYEFTNDSKGGVVPSAYIKPIELGIQEAMQSGVLAGNQMVDIKAILYDGSFHDVHSNERAFKIAAFLAFREAVLKAQPILQEPMMSVEVTAPEEYIDTIIKDLSTRFGRVESIETLGGVHAIKAIVPLSKVLGYATALQTLSQGYANFSIQFKKYDASPDEGGFESDVYATIKGPKRPPPGNARTNL